MFFFYYFLTAVQNFHFSACFFLHFQIDFGVRISIYWGSIFMIHENIYCFWIVFFVVLILNLLFWLWLTILIFGNQNPKPKLVSSSSPPLSHFLHWLQTSITQSFCKLEHFLWPFLKTRSHDRSAHTFESSLRFLEVPQKGDLNKYFLFGIF